MNNLAAAYLAAGKADLAIPLFEETLKLRKAQLGLDHSATLTTMNNLASSYRTAGKMEQALPLFEETFKLTQAKLGPDHPDTLTSKGQLAKAYLDGKQPEKALPLYTDLVAAQRRQLGANDPRFAGLLASFGRDLLKAEQFSETEALLRESLTIRKQKEPDAWTTFNAQSMLGEALLGQKKYADAEPLLLAGYEGLKERADNIPPQGKIRLLEALERIVQLYDRTGQKEAAAEWRITWEAAKKKQSPPVMK